MTRCARRALDSLKRLTGIGAHTEAVRAVHIAKYERTDQVAWIGTV